MQAKNFAASFWVSVLFVLLLSPPRPVQAQTCPTANASLSAARLAIHELSRNNRDPLAADCASQWFRGQSLSAENLADDTLVRFMTEAADRHRDAANKRFADQLADEGAKYHKGEVALRQRFLKLAAERVQQTKDDRTLRSHIVKNLSALANAHALRGEFREAEKLLSRAEPTYIDPAALSVWLQAVWSCAKFDGLKGNICEPSHRDTCRAHVQDLLESVSEMTSRELTRVDRKDIDSLRSRVSSRGCLK